MTESRQTRRQNAREQAQAPASAPNGVSTRPLAAHELPIAQRRYEALLMALQQVEQARQAWQETVELMTGGDRGLCIDTRAWAIAPVPPEHQTPKKEE